MAFDDQRGRTGGFSASLMAAPRDPNGGVNYGGGGVASGATDAIQNAFLGGGGGGFLQQGGNGGGYTNFSAYLLANPKGSGGEGSGTGGMNAIDAAMNNAYGGHNYNTPGPTPPPTPTPPPAPDPTPLPAPTPAGGSTTGGGYTGGSGGGSGGGLGDPNDPNNKHQR